MSSISDANEIQGEILKVARYFDEFCKSHNISYWLMGGSALGAIRHSGFIPWDDDFDVFLTSDSYEKLAGAFGQYLDDRNFYFQSEQTSEWPLYFSKLRSNHSNYIEENDIGRNMHNGVYIDIMRLCNGYDSKFFRYIQFLSARVLSAHALGLRGYKTNSFSKKFALGISRLLISDHIRQYLFEFVLNKSGARSKYLVHFFGRAPFAKACYERSNFESTYCTKFDSLFLPVCAGVKNYLETRFGPGYMLPPTVKEMAKYPTHCHKFEILK